MTEIEKKFEEHCRRAFIIEDEDNVREEISANYIGYEELEDCWKEAFLAGHASRETEVKELRECVRVLVSALKYYANVAKDDLEPKPEKAHLYEQDYPMIHPLWRQRSMSDYIGGKRARAVLKDHAETIERCL